MARPCPVCEHESVADINAALLTTPYRQVAKRFALAEATVFNHKSKHLQLEMAKTARVLPKRVAERFPTLAQAVEVREVVRADRLVDRVEELHGLAMGLLAQAAGGIENEDGDSMPADLKAAAALIREARGCLDLQARLLGEITAAQSGANHPIVESLMTALLAAFEGDAAVRERLIDVARRELARLTARR